MNDNLKFFREGDFVEYQGHYYYQGDPEGIATLEAEGYEFEDGELENTTYIHARRSVGCDSHAPEPYTTSVSSSEYNPDREDGTRLRDPEEGIIPDSDKVVLRRVIETEDYENPDHVLYSKEKDAYYCVSNLCTTCNVTPEIVSAEKMVTSLDIASQEPMVSSIVTKEPEWTSVFELKNLRENPDNLKYLDRICEKCFNLEKDDPLYVLFIQNTLSEDRSLLYKLNYLVNATILDPSLRGDLASHLKILKELFETFSQQEGEKLLPARGGVP